MSADNSERSARRIASYFGGRNRLPANVVARARQLLASGKSARETSRILKRDYGTILKIAHGKHSGGREKFVRCTKCGGLVELPCRLCSGQNASKEPYTERIE